MDDTPPKATAHASDNPRKYNTGGISTNTGNGSGTESKRPDLHSYPHIGKNNFLKVGWRDTNFYPSQWDLLQQITSGDPMTFIAGNTIALEASSLAYPPTNQFRWTAVAQPLNDDGTPQASLSTPNWGDAIEYSSGPTGSGTPAHFVIQAISPAPKQRWTISIPGQEDTYGNYFDDRINIYTPRSQY
jgi:hypothetical protein